MNGSTTNWVVSISSAQSPTSNSPLETRFLTFDEPLMSNVIWTLSRVPFNTEVYSEMSVHGERGINPYIDAWVTGMIGKHLQEDPRRALHLTVIPQVDWGVTAYRLGMSLPALAAALDPKDHAGFLAAIGPFTDTMSGPVHPIRPAAESSSSSSSASAARPS